MILGTVLLIWELNERENTIKIREGKAHCQVVDFVAEKYRWA